MKNARLSAVLLVMTCAASVSGAVDPPAAGQGGWQLLLGESSAPAWRGWQEAGFPAGWQVKAGVLFKDGPVDDLVTVKTYGNFELELEWKIGKAGNSGVFYRGTREYDHIYWSAPEYQLLDDANAEDGKSRLTAAGADYGLYGAPAGVVQPFDHWNKTRIVVNGNHVEHWLNGTKVVDYELKSADWTSKVAASKFAKYPNYGLAPKGLIGLQGDHPGALAIRNLRIRELP